MKTVKTPLRMCLLLTGCLLAGLQPCAGASLEDIPMDGSAEARALENALRKDPAWKPKFQEIDQIQVSKVGKGGTLQNFCLNTNGNILACCDPAEIRVLSPEGKLVTTWPTKQAMQAVCVSSTGAIFAAGKGRIIRLDQSGTEVVSVASPVADAPVVISKEIEEMLKEMRRDNADERKKMLVMLEARRAEFTGIAVTDQDVFVCVPTPGEFTYRVYRFNHNLQEPKVVVEKLRGCCGQMDIQAHGANLWVPHNARHRVECHDRDGKEISQFGQGGKVKPQDFGGCCEPKNLRVTRGGDVIVAESGPPTSLKRFSQDGKFLGVLGLVTGSKGDCVRVTVEVNADETRFYMLDTTKNTIRVFGPKS